MLRAGHRVDRELVEAAALLHDLDKALPNGDPLRDLGHGHAGARWLMDRGYPELAPAVDSHPVDRLTAVAYPDWVAATTLEQRVVAYADKRAQQHVVTLDGRFGRWLRRHPELAPQLALARANAARLETEICTLAGVEPVDVRRHRWAAAALGSAAYGAAVDAAAASDAAAARSSA